MNSKEALERIKDNYDYLLEKCYCGQFLKDYTEYENNKFGQIMEDLDKLEKLEIVIYVLNEICNIKLGNCIGSTDMYEIEIMGKHFLVDKERYYAFRKALNYDK